MSSFVVFWLEVSKFLVLRIFYYVFYSVRFVFFFWKRFFGVLRCVIMVFLVEEVFRSFMFSVEGGEDLVLWVIGFERTSLVGGFFF